MSLPRPPDPIPPHPDPKSGRPPTRQNPVAAYLASLAHLGRLRDASEGSYYACLQQLLEDLGAARGIRVLILPLPDRSCAPDLQVARRGGGIVGYVEVKRPGTDLDRVEGSAQLERYLKRYPNLLLTDTRELRLFRKRKRIQRVRLLQPWTDTDLHLVADLSAEEDVGASGQAGLGSEALRTLLATFFDFEAPRIRSARHLARDLASKAGLLRRCVRLLLEGEDSPETRELRWIQQQTQRYLVPDLPADRFADLYAQTVAYGLLAARYWFDRPSGENDSGPEATAPAPPFTRESAFDGIPPSVGLIRRLFRWMLLADLPDEIRWILDDLAQLLAGSDLRKMFETYFRDGKGSDPVLHFYETFLTCYDSEKRNRRGVYYTPPEVVSYIVRSAGAILERDFDLEDRLAHPDVTVLDPAAGTLTFLVEAVQQAFHRLEELRGSSAGPTLRDELLERFYGFELMVAPYVIGHLRMGLLLEELGCPLEERQSFQLLLADTLQMEPPEQLDDRDMALLARDALAALEIKKRVLKLPVILGNPPYSGHSANRSPWIERSLREGYERPGGPRDDGYYTVQGRPLGEKNPKWLQDDYVKFLRFAQWKVDQAGRGIVALVTNHSYLDNPTFRGLRESLLGTFDRLYLLDLHGSSKKRERNPEAQPGEEPEPDQNLFDIQQGVAIVLGIKAPGLEPGVFRHDVWGTETTKQEWLAGHDVLDTPWNRLDADPPGFYFVSRDRTVEERWRRFPAVDEMFEVGSIGVITGRDALVVDLDERELRTRMSKLRNPLSIEGAKLIAEKVKIRDTKTWRLEIAWQEACRDQHLAQRIERFLFRPFDRRWIAYAPYLLERPRQDVMHHLGGEGPARRSGSHRTPTNCALLVTRQAKRHPGAFVSLDLTGHKVLDTYDGNYVFPLYLLPPESLLPAEKQRQPNFRPRFLDTLQTLYSREIEPELLLGYLYAVLHSESYLDTYREMLATGFPRIPFPESFELFHRLAVPGWKLVQLHLPATPELRWTDADTGLHTPELERRAGLEAAERRESEVRLDGGGDGPPHIGKSRQDVGIHLPDEERLLLNEKGLSLAPIPHGIWEARVGSYRVLAQWLDARRGYRLTAEDLRHLGRVVGALQTTSDLRREIDLLYPEVEASPAALAPPVP